MDRTARLRHIVSRAKTLPFYMERLRDVDPDALSDDDVSALPFVTRDNLTEHFEAHAPHGGFLADDIVQMHLTPAPIPALRGKMPEYLTAQDIRWQADAVVKQLERCGLTPRDRCLVVFSYHMLAGGWLFHEGLTSLGATVLALGPSDAENVVDIAQTYGFNVLVSNPSFARKIGAAGGRFETLLAAGEPFSAVPGLREEVEASLECTAYDAYGLSETGVIAAETSARDGMHLVPEAAIVEVLDPQTLTPVAEGEKGEVVVTSLTRGGMPMLRFLTGDLTLKGADDLLPRGVFGRTDTMIKLKGVKVYPRELLFLLAATEGLNFRKYQLRVKRGPEGTDIASLRIEGDPNTNTFELAERIRSALGVGMNEIHVEDEVEGDLVVDERY